MEGEPRIENSVVKMARPNAHVLAVVYEKEGANGFSRD